MLLSQPLSTFTVFSEYTEAFLPPQSRLSLFIRLLGQKECSTASGPDEILSVSANNILPIKLTLFFIRLCFSSLTNSYVWQNIIEDSESYNINTQDGMYSFFSLKINSALLRFLSDPKKLEFDTVILNFINSMDRFFLSLLLRNFCRLLNLCICTQQNSLLRQFFTKFHNNLKIFPWSIFIVLSQYYWMTSN